MDVAGQARIMNFGGATIIQDPCSTQSVSDNPDHAMQWAAPEMTRGGGMYSKEGDVFSLAMVMIEVGHEWIVWTDPWLTVISVTQVLTGAAPFADRTPEKAMEAIESGERPPRPTHLTLTDELWGMMERCWDQGPRLRPKASEVLAGLHGS